MPVPDLTVEQVQTIIPEASRIEFLARCGQKIVFTGSIYGQKYALKFMSPNPSPSNADETDQSDDVTARAQREVETMRKCDSPNLVRIGHIGLNLKFASELIKMDKSHAYQLDNTYIIS